MSDLFASGAFVDLILAFMVLEAIVLIIVRKKTSRGLPPLDVVMSIAAGAALLLVVRSVIMQNPWQFSAFWLLVALLFHLGDLQRRWTTRRTS